MNTGVPIRTRVNSHSADDTCIRMQPCDSECPIDHGSEVPWMPTPGALNPIQRVPSGLPGPGGTGVAPAAHESWVGGNHHGFLCLTTTWQWPRGVGQAGRPAVTGTTTTTGSPGE